MSQGLDMHSEKQQPVQEWRVLLVDDDEDDYCLTRAMLSHARGRIIKLDWAQSYEQGQQLLQSNHYHAVLVDYDLGPRTGIELIRETASHGYPSPLILYTGHGSYEVDMEAMQAGATLYLTKSDANSLLLERVIRYAIENKQMKSELERRHHERSEILESIQDGFFAIDRDWKFIYVNQRAAKNVGITPEELLGRNIWEQYPKLIGTEYERCYRKVMEQHEPVQFEACSVYHDTWYSVSVYPSQEGISVYWKDITQHKRAEEARQLSEERFHQAFNASPNAQVISRQEDGRIQIINDSFERLFGYSRAEVIGKTSLELNLFANPTDREEAIRRLQTDRRLRNFELTIRTKSEEIRWAGLSVEIIPLGSETFLLTVIQDINERKLVEEALRKSEEKYAKAFRSSPVPLSITRASDGQLIEANESFCRMIGYRTDEVIGHAPAEFTLFDVQEELDRLVRLTMEKGPVRNREVKIHAKSGEDRHILFSTELVEIGGEPCLLARWSDITERKRAEDALRESEETLRLALVAARAGAWSWDLITDTVQWSDEYYRVFGYEPGRFEPSVKLGFSRVHPDDIPEIEALVRDAIARGTKIDVVHRVIWPDVSIHWVRGLSQAFYDEQGKPCRMAGIAIDITEQKQAEMEIKAAHRRTVDILESISDSFYSLDRDLRFTYVNQKAASLWGKQGKDLLGKNIWEVFPKGRETESYSKILQALEDRQPAHYESYSEFLDQWLEIHLYPTDEGISVFFQDITERKKVETVFQSYTRELERSNRDLQEFAFVASHDLQEPLRKIEALGDLILVKSENLTDPQKEQFGLMRKAAGRMRTMVDGLLQLSRLSTHSRPFQLVDLSQIVQEVLSDLELQLKRTGGMVEMGELPVIEADALQIRLLFQNLIGNALKFQSPGGKPHVKVYASQPDPETVQVFIQDNGIGFDQELAGRLFQPFQRLVGRSEYEGSGIGLAISRKIVERHGGEITVRSKPGQGATFIVTLPVQQNRS